MIVEDAPYAEWCIVELLGHRRLAGYLQEMQLAGQGFLRLDIPDANGQPGATQFISPSSVYALHPVSEDTARRAAAAWRPAPVSRWELPAAPAEKPETYEEAAEHILGEDLDTEEDDDGYCEDVDSESADVWIGEAIRALLHVDDRVDDPKETR